MFTFNLTSTLYCFKICGNFICWFLEKIHVGLVALTCSNILVTFVHLVSSMLVFFSLFKDITLGPHQFYLHCWISLTEKHFIFASLNFRELIIFLIFLTCCGQGTTTRHIMCIFLTFCLRFAVLQAKALLIKW